MLADENSTFAAFNHNLSHEYDVVSQNLCLTYVERFVKSIVTRSRMKKVFVQLYFDRVCSSVSTCLIRSFHSGDFQVPRALCVR